MSFFANLADAIPVVGHIKGIVHYAVGDSEGGQKAMYQATGTTTVLGVVPWELVVVLDSLYTVLYPLGY